MGEAWVGADPGGEDSFGLAFLGASGALQCETVSCVDRAVARILEGGRPRGIGIDAPMWWSSRKGGGRKADERIRRKYGIAPGTVQSINSLRGAALVGGALLASRIRQAFPLTGITESHPKALLKALALEEADIVGHFSVSQVWSNEHERDAGDRSRLCPRGPRGELDDRSGRGSSCLGARPGVVLARADALLLAREHLTRQSLREVCLWVRYCSSRTGQGTVDADACRTAGPRDVGGASRLAGRRKALRWQADAWPALARVSRRGVDQHSEPT